MTGAPAIELVDFGDGRRLERFGPRLLDRPAPAVDGVPCARPDAWRGADARFERGTAGAGAWRAIGTADLPESWAVAFEGLNLELRLTATGQVGLFPEHAGPAAAAAAAAATLARRHGRPAEVLNLFAYTGVATLLLARAGARVAHVDSSRPAVAWARRNAALSGLADAPVRWLVEDAAGFAAREVRRGRRYDMVLLDPPTYGHGPRGGGWRLDEGLARLLADCAALTGPEPGAVVLTAHTTGLAARDLRDAVVSAWGSAAGASAVTRDLASPRPDGRLLPAGWCVMLGP